MLRKHDASIDGPLPQAHDLSLSLQSGTIIVMGNFPSLGAH